jgi:tRNA-guanine family transglycosylase
MPGPLLHLGATVLCAHGGQATPSAPVPRVLVSGQPVATQAAMKAVLPETMKDLGAQCLLSNAFHLYERPGEQVLDEAGGLAKFMNWNGPTFTDSGGFQVLSLGAGFKKTLAMDVTGMKSDDVIAEGKERLAFVDEDGVTFKSPLNGSLHRFSAFFDSRDFGFGGNRLDFSIRLARGGILGS